MKVGMLGLLRVVVLVLVLRVSSSSSSSSSSASYFGQKNRRSSILPVSVPVQATTSSLMLNRVGSSIVFPLHGNVYPIGYVLYYIILTHLTVFMCHKKEEEEEGSNKCVCNSSFKIMTFITIWSIMENHFHNNRQLLVAQRLCL